LPISLAKYFRAYFVGIEVKSQLLLLQAVGSTIFGIRARPQGVAREGKRKMANTPHLDSAKILEFPTRTRSRGQRAAESGASVLALAPRRIASVGFTTAGYDAWYHEAAIRETDRDSGH
jgi:hypothetical protein